MSIGCFIATSGISIWKERLVLPIRCTKRKRKTCLNVYKKKKISCTYIWTEILVLLFHARNPWLFLKSWDVIFSTLCILCIRLINYESEYDSAVITFTFAKLGREATWIICIKFANCPPSSAIFIKFCNPGHFFPPRAGKLLVNIKLVLRYIFCELFIEFLHLLNVNILASTLVGSCLMPDTIGSHKKEKSWGFV